MLEGCWVCTVLVRFNLCPYDIVTSFIKLENGFKLLGNTQLYTETFHLTFMTRFNSFRESGLIR